MRLAFKNLTKNLLIIVLVFLILGSLFSFFSPEQEGENNISFTQLVKEINEGKIKKLEVKENKISVQYLDGSTGETNKESNLSLFESLNSAGVEKEKLSQIEVEIKEGGGNWLFILSILLGVVPFLFLTIDWRA